jgi:tetratricopeptide (TPR) repeat protein
MTEQSTRFRAEGRSTAQSIELSRVDLQISDVPLPDARVHAVLSRLASLRGDWKRAAEQADLAASMDGNDLFVLEQLSATRARPEERIDAAEKITLADPKRVNGWLLLGMSASETREAALKTALELDGSQPTAGAELAVLARSKSQAAESVDWARRAYRAPANARALAMSADVLFQAGLCGEALTLELRALESLPHVQEASIAPKLHGKLDELAACAKR